MLESFRQHKLGKYPVVLWVLLISLAAGQLIAGQRLESCGITLKWTAPGDDGDNGMASQYDIRYSTIPITEVTWEFATQITGEPTPKAPGSPETFTVTGLEPNTTYYFAIKTADEVPNWSDLSNIVSYTTDPPTDAAGNVPPELPKNYFLGQNYPNPFNSTTTIEYALPKISNVTLEIYNILGRKITTLFNEKQSAGCYRVTWNNNDKSTGVYFYRIRAGDYSEIKKMLLLK